MKYHGVVRLLGSSCIKVLGVFLILGHGLCAYSQTVISKAWDTRYGSLSDDGLYSLIVNPIGSIMVGGYSSENSTTGDKTHWNYGQEDFWVLKLDGDGHKIWDNTYGGSAYDILFTMSYTKDGGAVLGGQSNSPVSGSKSQPSQGGFDYWIVKIDSQGNVEWDKRFGGTQNEGVVNISPSIDGGYLIAGNSLSGSGGDKTSPNWDSGQFYYDIWLVKIDSLGNKEWDRSLGGPEDDGVTSVASLPDRGFILVGGTKNDSIGDISQHNRGLSDIWAVRIDSQGNKLWDKLYGGDEWDYASTIVPLSDGNFLIASSTSSGISGDKTIANPGIPGNSDVWILKIDPAGNIIWQKGFGGESNEHINSAIETHDHGFLLSCSSLSNAGRDKSEDNLGSTQTWLLKLDSSGLKEWDKTVLTVNYNSGIVVEADSNCFLVGTDTQDGIGGDKSQSNWDVTNGTSDYWVLKLCIGLTGLKDLLNIVNVSASPNPFISNVSICIENAHSKRVSLSLSNSIGENIYRADEANLSFFYTKTLDLSYLPNGIYFLQIAVDGLKTIKRLVKEE